MIAITEKDFKLFIKHEKRLEYADYYKTVLRLAQDYYRTREFNRENTAALIDQWVACGLSHYTINNYIKGLKKIAEFLGVDFLKNWHLFHCERPHIDILDNREMDEFLHKAYRRSFRKAVCLETFLKTGCRPNELFLATWDKLHGDELFITLTKTHISRNVVILKDLMGKIERLNHYPHNYIFGGVRGKINRGRFNEFIRECLRDAGIEKNVRTKELRHSYATLLASQGVSHFIIKEAMGHSTITTTEGYIHTTKSMLVEAAKHHPLTRYRMSGEDIKKAALAFECEMMRGRCPVKVKVCNGYIQIKLKLP